ncbi:membrane-associated proteases [Streptococcus criceti]|uniref:Peptidase M10 metallopeptidase domain-containing protein n=1 Tax=Streptococcus criceti HS-6 TaxID=873449 RepID=G5JTL8_STRCG|nr:matrixin family metalloprotease [Streptococcus criceti]EHI73590.1 hypothetical protein STRCR_1115 [Streptococcus criceti HS-6]SUN37690.1 membrane-associated proteases [Streptococcus criceti]
MKSFFKILWAIPKAALSFIWHFFWGFIRTLAIFAIIVFGLAWYANHSQSQLAQTVQTGLTNVTSHFSPKANFKQNLQNLATDAASDHQNQGARWETNSATVYLDSTDSTFVSAYKEAITAWNDTGAFTLNLVSDKESADIVLTDQSDSSSQAAGETKTTTESLTNRITHADVYLNSYYLLNDAYGYSQERIVNTAEHELGHAMGLDHNDSQASVMQSAGSYYSIQTVDIDALQKLYAN